MGSAEMLFGFALSEIVSAGVGGVVVASIIAVFNGLSKWKRTATDAKVKVTESEIKVAEVEQKGDARTFKEMQIMLRGATLRVTYLEGIIDEMRKSHAAEVQAMRIDIEDCRTERAAMAESIKWLREDRDELRTKSGEHNRPKEMP